MVPCTFLDLVIIFRGRCKGHLVFFGNLKLTFRDRCRRLEQFDVDVQILWQAQYFGDGGGLRHALISWQVQ